MNNGDEEYLLITSIIFSENHTLEKTLFFVIWVIYHTTIRLIKSYVALNHNFYGPKNIYAFI